MNIVAPNFPIKACFKDLQGFAFAKIPEYKYIDPKIQMVAPETFVGVEIEVENIKTAPGGNWNYFWHAKEDHSLRNHGMEYVTHIGLKAKQIPTALAELNDMFEKGNPKRDFSIRTGTHIHLNVQDFNNYQLLNLILLYILFENSIFEVSGKRQKNHFCVPVRKNDTGVKEWFRSLYYDDNKKAVMSLKQAASNMNKYMGFNLLPVCSFGSVEFRHHAGEAGVVPLTNWINILLQLHEAARNMPFLELKESIFQLNTTSHYVQLMNKVFPNGLKLPQVFVTADMKAGSTFIKEMFVILET